jgi:hypothetical protein
MNTKKVVKIHLLLLIFLLLAGISKSQTANDFKLASSAFEEGKPIPSKYTCDDTNISPPLRWSGFPDKTKSFALIMDDPDAPMGTWVHWVLYNIPGTVTSLEEKLNVAKLAAIDGSNSWEEKGYNGPCPPGGTHRYIFRLYALDQLLTPKEGMSKEELLETMKGHILGETALTGLFRI